MTTVFPSDPQQTLPPGALVDSASLVGVSMSGTHQAVHGQMNSSQRASNRLSGDYTTRRSYSGGGNGSMAVPVQPAQYQNGQSRNLASVPAGPPLDMARSPPNQATKNTKHVPCKFFRQGACQAGQACPFLHTMDATIDAAPCKYFTKGNCKFGAKCALAHILPDGRRVNRNNMGMAMGNGQLNLGGRVNPPTYHHQDSALASSLLSQQHFNGSSFSSYPYPMGEDYPDRPYDGMLPLDMGLGSNPTSKYGSPTDDSRMPLSPVVHHLSVLDAQLPASFDSNGISYIARHGPVAASVPSKFAHDSPSASLPSRSGAPSDAVRALHDTAYASSRHVASNLGSSPPATVEESSGAPRLLHSQRLMRSQPVSSSLPRPGPLDEWDEGFGLEEDLLPTNLHDDVLTPQEKARRTSRTEQDLTAPRDVATPKGIPSTSSSKVGSPMGSSPSRFASLFAKQRQQKEGEPGASTGHVGSPLRESLMSYPRSGAPGTINSRRSAGDTSPALSPSAQSSTSTLSQQLQNMRLKRSESADQNPALLPVVGTRYTGLPGGRFDRTVSSPGLTTSRIDEEGGDLVFSMEEEETNKKNG